MAEIPVTKKSGMPWWVWAAIGLIVLGLIYLFIAGGEGEVEPDRNQDGARTEGETLSPGETIAAIATIAEGDRTLAGSQVALNNVTIEQLFGERIFTITDGDATTYVVLDQPESGPDANPDGPVALAEGQIVDLVGEVFEVIDGQIDGETVPDMPEDTNLYVFASEVAIGG